MRVFRTSFTYENPLRSRFEDEFFARLPQSPGVYFMRAFDDEILYVGKAKCLRTRISTYRTAKPGKVGENIIEMLERVAKIELEKHGSEQEAIERERELIRAIVPPFNIMDAWEEDYLFIGIRAGKDGAIDFRLTSREGDRREFELYGCFSRRARVKTAYSSLLRLLFAASFERARFSFPARLARSTPAYNYSLKLRDAETWLERLDRFLKGESLALLEAVVIELLENERIPAFVRAGLQEDLEIVSEFFRKSVSALPRGLRKAPISQQKMRRRIRSSAGLAK